jgi:hypothetical protein
MAAVLSASFVAAGAFGLAAGPAGGRKPTRVRPQVLFGLGPEADGARRSSIMRTAPIRMLTSWFNGTSDFSWIAGWKNNEIPNDYAAGGYALHLIVYSAGTQTELPTRYGMACGLAYPLSRQFRKDMKRLAYIFRGPPGSRLYVTLFTEFQTYACNGNDWAANPRTTAYFKALKNQYRAALAIFHKLAPNSAVSLGWGGWQTQWDAPATGGGRSLFKHFADVMKQSDFESFEVINSNSDVSDVLAMTRELGRFGPVMLAYYRPLESVTGDSHLKTILSRNFLLRLTKARLFAISFMDDGFMSTNPVSFAIVSDAVRQFHCRVCGRRR